MDAQTQEFIERTGLFFERDGFPRIAGRVLGYLLLSPEPASLDELANALQVSKSSVSTDARLLQRMGKVERVTVPGDRRDYYRIARNMPRRMAALWRERLTGMRALLEAALTTPAAESPEVQRRLEQGARLMDALSTAVEDVAGVLGEVNGALEGAESEVVA